MSPTFVCLDADDYLQPRALELLMEAHRRTGGEVIYPDFFEDPEVEGLWKPYALDDWSCGHLTRKGTVHSVVAITPVEVWARVGGYAEGINWEDWDFQLRCAEAGVCTRRLALPLFNYRKWTGKRRDWRDGAEFEKRKADILARWRPYFEGEETFMSCSCGGQTIRRNDPNESGGGGARSLRQDPSIPSAVLVQYVGQKAGRASYRAVSGTVYTFSAGERPKYVKGEDLETFARLGDFKIIPGTDTETAEVSAGLSPALTT